jgi:phage shock protein A
MAEMDRSDIEKELAELGGDKAVEDDLARLKRELGMN